MSKPRNRFIYKIYTIGLIIVIGLAFLLLSSYIHVQSLPRVSDPEAFAQTFTPDRPPSGDLWTFGLEGRDVYSALFPFTELRVRQVARENCPGGWSRHIEYDDIWNVFWIEEGECYIPSNWWGPYRFDPE